MADAKFFNENIYLYRRIFMYWFEFFTGNNIEFGIIISILACFGYAKSLVFYNAFLHEIVTPDRADYTSAKGFTYGYLGSVILLIINLITIIFWKDFGFSDDSIPARLSFGEKK